jgi:ADP-heptose:LPS heptosyltransferase
MKILIVQLGRIGDMILLTPAIDAIKCKYPTSQLDILAGRHNYQAIKNNPSIDNIIVYEKSPLKLCKTLSTLLKTKYDYYIDPKDHKSSESKILATIARAKLKIGLNIDSSKVFDCSIPSESDNQGLHFSQRAFRALNHLSIETPAIVPKPFLYNTQDSLEYVDSFINAEQLDSFIVLNLSASMEHKMWDTENWIRLFKEFEYMQEKTVLSYAPAEKEKQRYC